MKHYLLILTLLLLTLLCSSQSPLPRNLEQQLENMTEDNNDIEPDDDAFLQRLEQFIHNPVNLNTAGAEEMQDLLVLTPLQIIELIQYRKLMGPFINVYELQAVPLWDPFTIRKIRPYITVSIPVDPLKTLKDRLAGGKHSILFRTGLVPERSKGYFRSDSSAHNFYAGSPVGLLLRYTYVYRNLLQYGITAKKDAGEQFFRGYQKQGFDSYSAHFFASDLGLVKAIALGDYTVNMGQGLVQWQGFGFKRSSAVMSVKREGPVLRPYNSPGEINFHRGLGITLGRGRWQASGFVSVRNIDAHFVKDSLSSMGPYVTSLQTSGYHRTAAEVADKGILHQLVYGGNIAWRSGMFHAGINGVRYKFSLPLVKSSAPYNKFALHGRSFANYSIDYAYTFRNLHLFGEAAVNEGLYPAFVQGILVSASAHTDFSIVYRNISMGYQSLNTNAFTRNTTPTNEKGVFLGMTLRPGPSWQVDAYTDLIHFPWLKYGVNAPSSENDQLVQVTYRPRKQLEIYSSYRQGKRDVNEASGQAVISGLTDLTTQNWRTEAIFSLSRELKMRSRVELVWYDKKGTSPEKGYLSLLEMVYKPFKKPFSGNIGGVFFHTDGYNSRIYAFENDVLFNFSIPFLYDKGFRYYVNSHYIISRRFSIWMKWARTVYSSRNYIGSGLDAIPGNHKSEVKLELRFAF